MIKLQKILTLLAILFLFSNVITAQSASNRCASDVVLKRQLLANPKMQQQRDKIEAFTNDFIRNHQQNAQNRDQQAVVTIPVVFHVVYNNATQNVSDQKLLNQIDVLNKDFSGTNTDVSGIPSAFQGVKAGNTNIQFCLAQQDPTGAATTGITRTSTSKTSFLDDDKVKFTSQGGKDIWDRNKYLNIWICNLGDDLLGYAQFPGGTANTDGVVILYSALPGGDAPYNLGRTATHEVGHWLNLAHIWGDSFCGDDLVSDTPTQQSDNSGCPTFPHVTCSNGPSGDMFMNYMDYVNDACMFMFSAGQSTRMNALFGNGGSRAALKTSVGCNTPGPAIPVANFSASSTSVCPGNTVSFTDLSTNTPTSWSWSFPGGTPSTSLLKNPTVTYNTAGTYNVTLTATNGLGSDGETKTAYISVATPTASALPLVENFQSTTFPPTGWLLNSNSGFNWARTTSAGGFGASSASMRFDNSNNDAAFNKDDILTKVLDMTGVTSPRVKFDVAYAPYSDFFETIYDTIEVLVTNVCTGLTTSIYKKGGTQLATASGTSSQFVPSAGQWRQDSVNIPAGFINNKIRVIFRNYGLYGNSVYIDNINVYGTVAAPVINAAFTVPSNSICQNTSLTFTNTSTGSPFDSIRWTFAGGTPSTSTASNPTIAYNSVGSFSASLKVYKSGISSTFNNTITVKSIPTVIVNSPSICSGTAASLTASGATTYTWSNGLGSSSTAITPILTLATSYTVTGTTNGCSNTATANVTIKPLPTTPIISQRNDTLFSNVVVAGATYEWYKNGIIAGTTSQPSFKFTSSGPGPYTLKITLNGCSSVISSVFNAVLTGLKNNTLSIDFDLVPNPNNGQFDISITSPTNKMYVLKLFNLNGQIIKEEELSVKAGKNVKQVNVVGIEKGAYFLSIQNEEGIATQSILIQ